MTARRQQIDAARVHDGDEPTGKNMVNTVGVRKRRG
jgi:hypothetical protein